MFRVIIAGGRDFKDYDLLVKTMNHLLSNIKDNITVVCGKARVPTRSESSMQKSTDCLTAVKCVAFGWALCYPLLRLRRPVWGFLVILSLAIVPFLYQFVSPLTHLWAHIIALLAVACLWGIYILWRKLLPRRPWLALAWSSLLGVALALIINQILWGATGLRPDELSTWSNALTGAVCFAVFSMIDGLSCRRRAKS